MPVSTFLVHTSEAMAKKSPVKLGVDTVVARDSDFKDLAASFLVGDVEENEIPAGHVDKADEEEGDIQDEDGVWSEAGDFSSLSGMVCEL